MLFITASTGLYAIATRVTGANIEVMTESGHT